MWMVSQRRHIGGCVNRALRTLEQEVLPCGCVFCGRVLPAGSRCVCDPCYAELPWLDVTCRCCGLPLSGGVDSGRVCGRCQVRPTPFAALVAPLRYEVPVDGAIKALKFQRRLYYAPALAALLVEPARRLPSGIDAMLPVPLHWGRQMRRGFNQAGELCRVLAADLGLPVLGQVRRTRRTPYQSGLGAGARRTNLRGAFALREEIGARHVLIVDDVVTTGATCEQLAATLLGAGVREVSVLAVARAVRPD